MPNLSLVFPSRRENVFSCWEFLHTFLMLRPLL